MIFCFLLISLLKGLTGYIIILQIPSLHLLSTTLPFPPRTWKTQLFNFPAFHHSMFIFCTVVPSQLFFFSPVSWYSIYIRSTIPCFLANYPHLFQQFSFIIFVSAAYFLHLGLTNLFTEIPSCFFTQFGNYFFWHQLLVPSLNPTNQFLFFFLPICVTFCTSLKFLTNHLLYTLHLD